MSATSFDAPGAAETAWKVCEPTSIEHEGPSRRLVQMATRFEIPRGPRIACFGSADLVRRDATGHKRWLMQADEVLYLHPDRVRLQGPAIDAEADRCRTWCWRWATRPTCANASSGSTGERVSGNLGSGTVGGVCAGVRFAIHVCRRADQKGCGFRDGMREEGMLSIHG